MRYIMSDIHGCYDKYIKMLELINFNENDELYILGDVLDRGYSPISIIDNIVANKNITLLKGNHEELFNDYFIDGDLTLWYMNGGSTTHNEIINKKDFMYEEALYKYIRKLPYIKVVDKFILVHGGLYLPGNTNELSLEELLELQEEDNCLWTRNNIGNELQFKDYTIIAGHTPVQTITNDYESDAKILRKDGHIYIDCGCYFEEAGGRLACLRLDDMKEFYV